MTTQKEYWDQMIKEFDQSNETLEDCVRSLFKILDAQEESDSGRVFNPTTIGSCRLEHGAKLNVILPKMRKLVEKE